MRVITWNCNMAFRKKAKLILKETPDVLIVQECESLDKLDFLNAPSQFWYGDNPNKGIGIFTFNGHTLQLMENHNHDCRFIIPLIVSTANTSFNLFAIWAQKSYDGHYTRQVWKALDYYDITKGNVLLIGDFNSSSIWDKPNRTTNHSNMVERLKLIGIESVYHKFYECEQGKDLAATLFFYRKRERTYHIDYCFASSNFIRNLTDIKVGRHDDWVGASDHMPLIIDFENNM